MELTCLVLLLLPFLRTASAAPRNLGVLLAERDAKPSVLKQALEARDSEDGSLAVLGVSLAERDAKPFDYDGGEFFAPRSVLKTRSVLKQALEARDFFDDDGIESFVPRSLLKDALEARDSEDGSLPEDERRENLARRSQLVGAPVPIAENIEEGLLNIPLLAKRDTEAGEFPEGHGWEIVVRRRIVGFLEALKASRERAKQIESGEGAALEGGENRKRSAAPDVSPPTKRSKDDYYDSFGYFLPPEVVEYLREEAARAAAAESAQADNSLSKRRSDGKEIESGEGAALEGDENRKRSAAPVVSPPLDNYYDSFGFTLTTTAIAEYLRGEAEAARAAAAESAQADNSLSKRRSNAKWYLKDQEKQRLAKEQAARLENPDHEEASTSSEEGEADALLSKRTPSVVKLLLKGLERERLAGDEEGYGWFDKREPVHARGYHPAPNGREEPTD